MRNGFCLNAFKGKRKERNKITIFISKWSGRMKWVNQYFTIHPSKKICVRLLLFSMEFRIKKCVAFWMKSLSLFLHSSLTRKNSRVNPRHTKQRNNNVPFQEATKNPVEIDSNYKNKRDETDLHIYSCARISIWMWQPSHTHAQNSSITSVNQLFFCRPSFRGKCRLFKNLMMKRMRKKGKKK